MWGFPSLVGNNEGNCSYLHSSICKQKHMLEMPSSRTHGLWGHRAIPQNWTWQVWHVLLFTFYCYEGNCSYLRCSLPVSMPKLLYVGLVWDRAPWPTYPRPTQVDQKWPLLCHLSALVLHSSYRSAKECDTSFTLFSGLFTLRVWLSAGHNTFWSVQHCIFYTGSW